MVSKMTSIADALQTIRGQFSKIKIPGTNDKVYNDECMHSFDSPFTDTGLYVNMSTFLGYGVDYFLADSNRSGTRLYVHLKWTQVPLVTPVSEGTSSAPPVEDPSKLAIGIGGGFITESKFDIVKEHSLVVIVGEGEQQKVSFFALPNADLPEFVSNVAQAIIDHGGMKNSMQVDSWDASNEVCVSKYADALIQLPATTKISQDPSSWRCAMSGECENLWLNLSTGYIGGGRKNWDGSGGSGAALQHYRDTGGLYPLCVKLGTITANSADVWSYADDEDCLVTDPKLPEHLAHWGIDIMKLEKTDKSMTEMEVALNMKYDWSRIMESGENLVPLTGAGYVGLRNIGSSCYLNAVMQTLLAVPEIQQRYYQHRPQILANAPSDPSSDFPSQFSKLAAGILSDRYVAPAVATTSSSTAGGTSIGQGEAIPDASTLEKYVVAPRMFKQLVGKNHREFSSNRQQDASEYYQYFLNTLIKAEKSSLNRFDPTGTAVPMLGTRSTASLFEFHIEERLQCAITGQVKYTKISNNTLCNQMELRIPLEQATNRDEVEIIKNRKKQRLAQTQEGHGITGDGANGAPSGSGVAIGVGASVEEEEDDKLIVPLSACLSTFFVDETIDYRNPSLGPEVMRGTANKTVTLATFPPYLMVKLGRYYVGENWVQVKVDARVPMPEELDLSAYRAHGLLPGETPIVDPSGDSGSGSANAGGSGAGDGPIVPDETLVLQLMAMGFSENGCKRAAVATQNADVDTACSWVFEHMEDSDFNDPLPVHVPGTGAGSTAASVISADSIAMMEQMGVTARQAKAALTACDGDVERAVDWVFSRDNLDEAVNQILLDAEASNASGSSSSGSVVTQNTPLDGPGKYSLMAIVSHIGKNTDHGHYVCHIKKDNQWAFFNDEKVAQSKVPPLEHGFMYLYRRNA